MNLPGVLFLAARTPRSQAYAQAMAAAGLAPEHVLVFGDAAAARSPHCERPGPALPGLFRPDLSVPLADTLDASGWRVSSAPEADVNAPGVAAAIRESAARLVIYSGYGGQIVGAAALGAGPQFLHLHAGLLPLERGSTTVYYGMLARGACGVSAILLRPRIDTGPVIARRDYPVPPAGVDVDHLYDGAIRADLLVSVLRHYAAHGRLPESTPQELHAGSDHYIIHPVLKHIALLARPAANTADAAKSGWENLGRGLCDFATRPVKLAVRS